MTTKEDTTNSVEDLYGSYESESSGGLFLKFEDDKIVKLRLGTEPYIFVSRFEDKKTGEITVTKKYAWVIFNRDGDRAQILQLPGGGYDLIAGLVADEEYGNPADYDLKIVRKNTNGKYSYQVNGSPKRSPITEEEMKAIADIDIVAVMSKDDAPIMPLRAYLQAGKKFPGEGAQLDADGTPIITDLDDSNPLNSLDK